MIVQYNSCLVHELFLVPIWESQFLQDTCDAKEPSLSEKEETRTRTCFARARTDCDRHYKTSELRPVPAKRVIPEGQNINHKF